MKSVLLTTTLLFLTTLLFANHNSCLLKIRDSEGKTIVVSIDGKRYDKPGRTITIGDLPAGYHSIKVYQYNSNNYNNGRNGHYNNGRGGYNNGNARLIYRGNIRTRASYIYYCTVDDFEEMQITEKCCINNNQWNNNSYNNWNDNHNNHNNDDYNDNDNWENNNHNDHHNNYDNNSWGSYNGLMSDGRFNQLLDQIQKASFESSKTSVLNQALEQNRINCNQLRRILDLYSFESTKLQIAKDAYKNVVDTKNYYILNDVFTFQSSKDELANFLNHQR